MDYPLTKALVEHLLDGLRDSEKRRDSIEARVTAAISKMPEAEQRKLTVDAVFAGVAAGVAFTPELRSMIANPAFKNEPVISQLRRAEATFIEAHDAYRADPCGRRAEEMRWAHARLVIARQVYGGMIESLPPAKREAAARPKITVSKAIRQLRLDAFSDDEQRALRLWVTDQAAAIARLDDIIAAGRASSRHVSMILAYLIDPASKMAVERWLVDELGSARAREPAHDAAPAPLAKPDQSADVSDIAERRSTFVAPDKDHDGSVDPEVGMAIEILEAWLADYPVMLTRFVHEQDRWVFKEEIKSRRYAGAYALVAHHPTFQRLIDRLKSHSPMR